MAHASGTSKKGPSGQELADLMVKNLKGADPHAYDEKKLAQAKKARISRYTAGRVKPAPLNPDGSLVEPPPTGGAQP